MLLVFLFIDIRLQADYKSAIFNDARIFDMRNAWLFSLTNVASCVHRMKDDWNKEDEILQLHMTIE